VSSPQQSIIRSASSNSIATTTPSFPVPMSSSTLTRASSERDERGRGGGRHLKAESGEYRPRSGRKTSGGHEQHEADRKQEAIMHANPLLLHQPHVFPVRHWSGNGAPARRVPTDGFEEAEDGGQCTSRRYSNTTWVGGGRARGTGSEVLGRASHDLDDNREECDEEGDTGFEQTDWESEDDGGGDARSHPEVNDDHKVLPGNKRGEEGRNSLAIEGNKLNEDGKVDGGNLGSKVIQPNEHWSQSVTSDAVSEPGEGPMIGQWISPGEQLGGTGAAEWPRDDYASGTRLRHSRFRSSGNLNNELFRQEERMTQVGFCFVFGHMFYVPQYLVNTHHTGISKPPLQFWKEKPLCSAFIPVLQNKMGCPSMCLLVCVCVRARV
jgi:hypothetical protein